MNAFAENPFFFFLDNVPPIPSNAPKNAKRIVELSDTGCDARLSVSTLLRNATRYYSSKSAKMRSNGNWRTRCEDRGGRFRGQSERNAVNAEESYFVPRETETAQNYWQYPVYEDDIEETEYERKSENKDFRINSKITPERMRRWRQENNVRHEHSVPKYTPNVSRNNTPLQSKIGTNHSQLPRFNYCRTNAGSYDQETLYDRGRRRRTMDQDYPENLEKRSKDSRNHRDHWRRDYNENLIDEISYQSHNLSSGKSNDDSRYWKETTDGKIRPGIGSPSTDRRKRTQPISETLYENAESQYDVQAFQDSGSMTNNVEESLDRSCSAGKFKRFVDRAVDKDSISDILNESVSKERLSVGGTESQTVNDEGNKVRNSFWEFISLNDHDDQKTGKSFADRKPAWLFKRKASTSSNGNLNSKRMTSFGTVKLKTKGKIDHTSVVNHESGTMSNSINVVEENSTESKNSNNVGQTELNTETEGEALENRKNLDKNQNVIENRSNRLRKFGFSVDRKKQVVDNGVMENLMEETVTSVERKLEKSKLEESSNDLNQSSPIRTEKKIRSEGSTYSRLPIRIGRRLRSKNPIATRLRTNVKGCIFPDEENKDMIGLHEEADGQENPVRSRTKPKVKSNLAQQEVVLNSVEVVEYSKSMGNVLQIAENNGYSDGNEKGDENLFENNVNDELIDDAGERLSKAEKSGSNIDDRVIASVKIANTAKDQRKNGTGSARGRKSTLRSLLTKEIETSRDGFKENCVFNMHDEENVVCNTYCNKDCRKSNCIQSKKPIFGSIRRIN